METQHFFIHVSIDNQPVLWEVFNGCLLDAKTQAFLSASDFQKLPHQTLRVEISRKGIKKTSSGILEYKDVIWEDVTH